MESSMLTELAPHPLGAKIGKRDRAFYRPELDLLRLIAFLLVFGCHATAGLSGTKVYILSRMGSVGMCLFFFLSSYLITVLLLKEKIVAGHVSIGRFFARRILRIWPLYFMALLLAVAQTKSQPQFFISKHHLLAYLLFFGNWYSIAAGPIRSPWSPLWSINVEEQFYLTWPFLSKGSRGFLLGVSLLSMGAGVAVLFYLGEEGYRADDVRIWYNSFVQFLFFGAGSLLALTLGDKQLSPSGLIRAVYGGVAVVSGFLFSWVGIVPAQSAGLVVLCYGLALLCSLSLFLMVLGLSPQSIPAKLLRWGKISFGLYVFHGPVLAAMELLLRPILGVSSRISELPIATLGLILTIACAELSYRFLEEPFLRLKKRMEVVPSRPV